MAPGMSLFSVNAIIILSADDGSRIFAKYYDAPHRVPNAPGPGAAPANPYPDLKSQKTFEKGLLEKTAKQSGDIILCASCLALPFPSPSPRFLVAVPPPRLTTHPWRALTDDNRIVLYKMESDVMMYVVGGVDENEILLYNVILSLRDSLHLLFK